MSSTNKTNSSPTRSGAGVKRKRRKRKQLTTFGVIIRAFLIIFLILAFAIAGAVVGAYVGIIKSAPDLSVITVEPNNYTSIIYDSAGNEIDRLHGEENREYATLDQMPKYMADAVVAIEDSRFYIHNGIDMKGILRAAKSTLTGQQLQGGSTITQQLIKNNVTKVTRNNVKTKLQEQFLSTKYEKELTAQLGSKEAAKKYILELYLNTIALGHGYSGVQAAALGYFGKDASELTLAECASVAGITNNPSLYSPRTQPEKNKQRQTIILEYMLEQGYITQEEYDAAIAEDIYSKISASTTVVEDTASSNPTVIHSYFVDSLFDQISNDLQDKYNMSATQANYIIYNGGLTIRSTMDSNIQNILDETYKNNSLFPNVRYGIDTTYNISIEDSATGQQEHKEFKQFARTQEDAEAFVASKRAEIEAALPATQKVIADKASYAVQPQSAMVIMDYKTGNVKALTGGRGEKTVNRGFNRAVDSARQPGSVFKVLAAYAPAIDTGKFTAASVIKDEPYKIGNYAPSNWWGKSYRGNCTVRTGIRDSMNILAVKTMVETGIDVCYSYLLNFGFTTLEDDNHAATALGGLTNGVTQLEVTAAYGAIANNGEYRRPMLYTEVIDHDGNMLLENNEEPRQVLKPTTAFILTDMMKDVVTEGTGTKAKFVKSKMPVSGKTGTTTDSKDLTFVGYTPYYVAGIWLGYDRYDDTVKNMNNVSSDHLVVWRTAMEKIHEGLEVKDFAEPSGLVKYSVCKTSGKKPANGCPTVTDYFTEGTGPSKYCGGHETESSTETTTAAAGSTASPGAAPDTSIPDASAGTSTPTQPDTPAQPEPVQPDTPPADTAPPASDGGGEIIHEEVVDVLPPSDTVPAAPEAAPTPPDGA